MQGAPFERLPVTLQPHPNLMKYYALSALAYGPLYPFAILPLYFMYRTLRYEFDDEGITMRWGILFRREISLTYARIQDIHLSSNVVERWLGLARIQVQTASGSAKAEMSLSGLREFDAIRDFLYSRMRGAHQQVRGGGTVPRTATPEPAADEVADVLREVTAELRALRHAIGPRDA